MTVRAKVLLYFFVPALCILGAVAALLPTVNERTAEVLAGERNGEIASLLADQLANELMGYAGVLDAVAARPEIYRFEPAAQQLALRALVGQLRQFDAGVVVVDANGRVTAADARRPREAGADWSGYDFVRRAIDDPGPAVTSGIIRLASGEEVVALALPVRVPGSGLYGLIAGLFTVDPAATSGLRESLVRLPRGAGRRLIVVDSANRAVYHDSAELTGSLLGGYPGPAGARVARFRPANGADELLVAAAGVPDTGWRLILEEPWSGLAATYRGATRLLLGLLLLGLLAPALVVGVGAERVTRPIGALTAAVRGAAAGELGQQVTVRTGDELEVLADQFNEMSTRLAASYAELEERVAERTRELNALYEQAKETATLAERNRIARELHDSVTQTIFSAKLVADVLPRLAERDPELAKAKLADLQRLTGGALAEMRSLLVELRPAALFEANLAELLHNLAAAAKVRGGTEVVVVAVQGAHLPPDVQETFYRIAQEALNNALKHAHAESIRVTYAVSEADGLRARLELTDDGVGVDPAAARATGHFGLAIMAERAAGVGADLVVGPAPVHGTRVVLTWNEPRRNLNHTLGRK